MDASQPTLRGRRALLEPLTEGHATALFEAGREDEIWSYMPFHPTTIEEMEGLVAFALKARDRGEEWPFVIVDQESGAVVGSTRIFFLPPPFVGHEIGWTWHSPSVWRTRINTECKYLLFSYCFEELGSPRVQLKTDVRNERSQAAIARLGAVREGTLRKHMKLASGYIRDSVYFSVTDDEWPGVKERLEGFLAS
ncbi:MAG: GNAT family protein [Dehalococcoidia bacterium]